MKSVIAWAALALLAGPALAQPQAAPPEPMPLYGVTVGAAGVTFRAPRSNACPARSDYTVAVLKRQPQDMLLLSSRRAGQCPQTGAGHIDLAYGFEDLGLKPGQPFVLANPLVGEP
jgi:hypothetical protein